MLCCVLKDLTSLMEFKAASLYESEGFWVNKAAEQRRREELVAKHRERLEQTWQRAIAAAEKAKSFELLCAYLEHIGSGDEGVRDEHNDDGISGTSCRQQTVPILPAVTWRYELMPYGGDNRDTHTFPVPDSEKVSFLHLIVSALWRVQPRDHTDKALQRSNE